MLDPAVRWRIDKDEVSSIFTRMRCNLMGEARTKHVVDILHYSCGCACKQSHGPHRPATGSIGTGSEQYHAVYKQAIQALISQPCSPPAPHSCLPVAADTPFVLGAAHNMSHFLQTSWTRCWNMFSVLGDS